MYVMINQCPGSEIKTKKEKLVLKLQLQRLQHHTVFPISTYKYFFYESNRNCQSYFWNREKILFFNYCYAFNYLRQ